MTDGTVDRFFVGYVSCPCISKRELEDEFRTYGVIRRLSCWNSGAKHEAGYDAFITGRVLEYVDALLLEFDLKSHRTSFHALVRSFEGQCGSLSQYGMKHMRSLANICNAGVKEETMAEVASQACPSFPSNPWSSLHKGFSA